MDEVKTNECNMPNEPMDKMTGNDTASKKKDSKKWIACGIGILVVLVGIIFFQKGTLTNEEKVAVKNCEYIIDCLKNPDSFQLYSDIEILRTIDCETDELNEEYMFIDYGGTNSYGGVVRSTAAFDQLGYLADLEDNLDEDDFSSFSRYQSYNDMKVYRASYKFLGTSKESAIALGLPFYMELVTVPQETVEQALGLE